MCLYVVPNVSRLKEFCEFILKLKQCLKHCDMLEFRRFNKILLGQIPLQIKVNQPTDVSSNFIHWLTHAWMIVHFYPFLECVVNDQCCHKQITFTCSCDFTKNL